MIASSVVNTVVETLLKIGIDGPFAPGIGGTTRKHHKMWQEFRGKNEVGRVKSQDVQTLR